MNRHMREQHSNDSDFKRWLEKHNNQNTKYKKKYVITPDMLVLLRYCITSYGALSEFNHPDFRIILAKAKLDTPCDRIFKSLLDEALEKLDEAKSVCLITDIWTNKKNEDFIAVSASLIFEGYVKEVFTIGMMLMEGGHTAEYIQISVEKLVNKFKFNKAKIVGIVSDEGSALVRLFKQISNEDLETIDLLELNEDERHILGIIVDEFETEPPAQSTNQNDLTANSQSAAQHSIEASNFDEAPARRVIDEEIRNTLSLIDKLRFTDRNQIAQKNSILPDNCQFTDELCIRYK
jgi:hypothetical protein